MAHSEPNQAIQNNASVLSAIIRNSLVRGVVLIIGAVSGPA
jgi:hypothetical protein